MVTNVNTPAETTETVSTIYENYIREWLQRTIIWLAMLLRSTSDKLLALVDHQIVTTTAAATKPYSGPTYGKLANTTRQTIAGKIAHEKGYTGNTGWLYSTIAGLIDRRANKLEISLSDLELETGLSEQSIITHTSYLEELGLIHVDRESAGPKSNKINIYSLLGEGANVTLWNGGQKNITTPKSSSKFLATPVKNLEGKDSLQTNSNKQAAAAVKKETSSSEKIELSPQQQAAINALKDVKISAKVARELVIQHDDELERLFATIKCAQVSSSIRNPAGFVCAELGKNEQDLSWDIVSNGWQTLDDYIKQYLPKAPQDYAPAAKPEPAPIPPLYDKPAGPELPELPPLPEVDPLVKEQWTSAYNQLQLQFDRQTFDTWLRGAQVIGCEDGVFVIGVRDGYVRDMLQHRLYRNVRRVFSDVCGKQVELRFEVCVQLAKAKCVQDDDEPLFRRLARNA